jgi:hypothetical protein
MFAPAAADQAGLGDGSGIEGLSEHRESRRADQELRERFDRPRAAAGDGRAKQVAEYLRQSFYVAPRATAFGELSGYRPFLGATAPDVIWSEGTIEAATALHRLGVDATAADDAVARIRATIGGNEAGPAGADRNVIDPDWGEFHTWPTSAAASWLLIRDANAKLLFAH